MKLVFDSTTLIYLGKERVLEKLQQVSSQRVIPLSVYGEVVNKGNTFEEAFYIKRLVDQKLFEVKKIEIDHNFPSTVLSPADQEVLSFARKNNFLAVMDENEGRQVADVLEIETIGSIGLLFELLDTNKITKKEMKTIVGSMIKNGWFCSTPFYSRIMEDLDK